MADVLKVLRGNIADGTGVAIIDGSTSTTYTVLSVSLCNTSGNDRTFSMWHSDAASANAAKIYEDQSLPAKATFIHNDKIVLEAEDELWVNASASSSTINYVVSFLEQTA